MEETVSTRSYADAVGNSSDLPTNNEFQAFMKVAKVGDLSEERDRKLRAPNIIIHGIKESKINLKADDQKDKEWFERFQKILK